MKVDPLDVALLCDPIAGAVENVLQPQHALVSALGFTFCFDAEIVEVYDGDVDLNRVRNDGASTIQPEEWWNLLLASDCKFEAPFSVLIEVVGFKPLD